MSKLTFLLGFLFLIGLNYASGCGALPLGANYCAQATIPNLQTSAVSAGTQLNISIVKSAWATACGGASCFDSGYDNWVFYNYTSGAKLYCWLQTNPTGNSTLRIWCKSDTAIGASSTDSNIYIAFFSSSSQFSNPLSYSGEAPQISAIYGEYDNGAKVFNNYWNFTGTTTPTGISITGSAVSFNNGAIINLASPAWSNYIITTASYTAPLVIDSWGAQSTQSASGAGYATIWSPSSSLASAGYAIFDCDGTTANDFGLTASYQNGVDNAASGITADTNYHVITLGINSAGNVGFSNIDYGFTQTSSTLAITSGYIGLQTTYNIAKWYWLLTRTYAPNGVLPLITLSTPISPTTTTTSSTTTISTTTTINGTMPFTPQPLSKKSIPYFLSFSFLVPYFALFVIIIVIGAVWNNTKKLKNGLVAGFATSLILYFISSGLVSPIYPAILLIFAFGSIYLEHNS